MYDLTPNPSPERRGGLVLEIFRLLSPLPLGEGPGVRCKNKYLMKNTYQILYVVSVVLLLVVLLGGTITKPIFNNFSARTLETAGIKKASIDSLDSKYDEIMFTVTKVELQIEKLKNLFSDKEIDENKFQKQKHELFTRNIYNPLNELAIIFFRIGFFFISIILLLAAVIAQLIYRSFDLRMRVNVLEKRLNDL